MSYEPDAVSNWKVLPGRYGFSAFGSNGPRNRPGHIMGHKVTFMAHDMEGIIKLAINGRCLDENSLICAEESP